MNGLYALKPWYAERLAAPRQALVRHDVAPEVVSWSGVGFAAAAGAVLALRAPGVVTGVVVAALLAGRLACANLDGGLARATGRSSRWGGVTNELTDRLADLAALAGLATHAPLALVAACGLGASLPSWVALAGAAHGAPRRQGGPVGKTERCAVLAVAALAGHAPLAAAVVAAGGLVTAAVRLSGVRAALAGGR